MPVMISAALATCWGYMDIWPSARAMEKRFYGRLIYCRVSWSDFETLLREINKMRALKQFMAHLPQRNIVVTSYPHCFALIDKHP
jgi:hypothetical protein